MRLYRTKDGRWAGTQSDAGKGFTQIDVPTDKPGLLAWLNENAQPPTRADYSSEAVEANGGFPKIVPQAEHYQSPFSAATTIAKIDAKLCATALKQMDGDALAIVTDAVIERLASLKALVPVNQDIAA